MPILDELISNNIRNALYYNAYLEMVVKHDQKVAAKKEGKKKTVSAKQPKSKPAVEKSSKPAPAPKPKATKERPSKASTAKPPKPKPAKEKSTKTTLPQPTGKGKVVKVRKAKSPFQLVDKPDEEPAHSEREPKLEHKGEGDEDEMELAIQMSLESFQAQSQAHVGSVAIREPVAEATRPLPVVEGKGKAIATEEQAAHSLLALHIPKRRNIIDQFVLQRRTPVTEEVSTGPSTQAQDDTSVNIVRDSPSPADAKIETGVASEKTNSGCDTEILQFYEEQEKDVNDLVNLEEKTDELDQGLAGSDLDPEPTYDEFMADLYLKVQEILKFPADKHVILEEPLSSSGTLSPMKNLDDAYTIGDQFINDKSTEDELGKFNVESKVVSLHPLRKHQSSKQQQRVQQQTFHFHPLYYNTLEQKLTAFEQKRKTLDNTTQNLGSRVFTLELRDLPHKIDEAVRESVKEAVHIDLQAPLRDRFGELPEADMKEILHQWMFESGSYKSLLEHVALYKALEASIKRAHRDEFLPEKDKSRKRRRDDQDPPPPPPDSDLGKRRRHDTDASSSSQPQAPQSSAWKKSDTQEAPPSSSKQQYDPYAEQPVEDIPMPHTANIFDSEDTDSAHLLKIKQMPEWLKPILDDERPATPEPVWVIPSSHIPDAENNWANALATTYQASAENSLLEKTGDIRTFMHWYCQHMGKIELTQADFKVQAYEVVKAFYPDVIHLQFQMEDCHKMLTDQIY
nr:hypothetical protein [Tanacetum cinerariifolium]